MTAASFTPGPWSFDGRNLVGGNGERVLFSGHIGIAIASKPQGWANDNLLLAAPDLYEALAGFIAYLDKGEGYLSGALEQQMRDAVAKAVPASVDTRPKDGDAVQQAAPLASGAVPNEDSADAKSPSS
jgi:hypothetical protein